MQYEQGQNQTVPQASQSYEQRDRVKQGGIDIDHDNEHVEGSTLNTLENLSASNLDHHEAGEIIHKGWEKATDKIAAGVEVVKRLIMQELPPVEGENLKEKAENIKEIASEKIQEVKEKVEEKVETAKEATQDIPSKPKGSEIQRGSRTSEQTDLYRSGSGSNITWQPTQEMKEVAREKLGEYKERYQNEGRKESRGEEDYSAPQQESAVLIEEGREVELSGRSNEKLHEVEALSQQLNQKVEELKKSAGMPTNQAGETIIIIQEGTQEAAAPQQSQFVESQQRPKLGHRDEQEWRNYQGPSEGSQPNEGGEPFTDKISRKAQEVKEGYKQGFDRGVEKASSNLPTQEGEYQEGGRSITGRIADTIKEKATEKVDEIKGAYQSNLQEIERNAENRWTGQPQEHHESEHHLTTESQSFKPSAESKSLLKQELPSNEGHHESEHHLRAEAEAFKPSRQSKNLLKQELGNQGGQKGQENLESQASNLKQTLEGQATQLKEKLGEAAEQIKEKILPSGQESQEQTSTPPAEIKETITYHPQEIRGYEIEYVPKHHDEGQQSQPKREEESQPKREKESQPKREEESQPIQERIPFLDRVAHGFENAGQKYQDIKGIFQPSQPGQGKSSEETGYHEEHLRTGAPPSEIHENITYHPRDIRGYEVEYVPKNEGEGSESHSQGKSSQKQVQAPPAEIHETITYHPRDIRGYEVEYVPKNHSEGQSSQPQDQGQSAPQYVPKEQSEGQHPEGQETQQQPEAERVPLLDRVQQGLGNIRGYFHHEQKEAATKVPEKSSELSNILESQAEVLKTKYSALKNDQPHGEELLKSEKAQEGPEGQGGKGIFGRVSGALHNLTDKFSHGTEGKDKVIEHEEPKKAESPREKIYEFNPQAKKAEEKPVESEEKSGPGFVSRIGDRISHGIDDVKGRFQHSNKEEPEKTSTEKNQSVFEKIQGKVQGKQTGEEVDKNGFKKVHDGFSETVVEFKHEQNEQYLDQIHVANENPFEPLRTKQAALIDHPVESNELVGGNLKKMTADFDESKQEMIPEEDEEERRKRGLLQKMKEGIFSKFGHGNKETDESA